MAGRSGAIRAGRAFVELFADNNPLARDLKEGVAKLRRFATTARAIGQSIAAAGLKIAAPFALSTAVFVGFEDQMAEVRAVTQASAKDFATLTDQAKRLGRTTSFMAKEVAGAQTELGRAGFNPAQIQASTSAILALARGTKTELAQAAQIGADSLRAFRLEAGQMPRVADVLVATANNSSQGLTDLFEALKTVGPVAADVGASIEDTAAAIGVLANNGIKGTLAGNALKRAYLNLANPTIRKKIEALTGVSAVDAAGNLRPLASVITDIGKATNGLPNAKRLDIFSQIFGDRAVVAASAFAGSAGNFRDLQGVLDGAAGTAERTAGVMDDTLGGSFRKLMSAVEGVAISIGETIAPAVRDLADHLTNAAGHATAFVKENQTLVIGLAMAGTAAVAAGVSLIAIGGAVSVLTMGLSGLGSVVKSVLFPMPMLFGALARPAKMARAAIKMLAKSFLLLGGPSGVVTRVVGGTLVGAMKLATRATVGLAAASLTTAGHLAKTTGILLGNVATGFDSAASAIGGASRKLSSAGRSVALASTALTRTAGRASYALVQMAAASAITTTRLTVMTTALTVANARALAASGFRKAAGGMRLLSMGALNASTALKAAGKSIRGTMALARVGTIATSAGAAIAGAATGLLALVTSPVALFGALAAGAVAAILYAAGSVEALKRGLSSIVGSAATAFSGLASQAGNAWRAISSTGGRAIGGIVALIKAGDMEGAFKIATTAIALMWSQVVTSFVDTWAPIKVALVSGWNATAKLFGDIFGGAISFLRDMFSGFTSWFSSGSGASVLPNTMADAVAAMAEMMAAGWSIMKSTANDAIDVIADGWDTFTARITNAWATAIGFIQKGWTRLKAMFDSDIDVEAEVKEIDKVNAAGNASRNSERDRKIAGRAAANKAAKEKATVELAGQLEVIEQERQRKNQENKTAIAAEKETAQRKAKERRAAFEDAMSQTPVDAVADTGKPAAAATSGQSFQGSGGGFGLPSATAAERRKAAKSFAKATAGEKKKFERNEKGQLLDPESGRPVSEILASDKQAATTSQATKFSGSGAALSRTEGRLAGSLGSFSARAAAQSGAGSVVMNKIADATTATADAAKATATNTENIANGIEDLGGMEAE